MERCPPHINEQEKEYQTCKVWYKHICVGKIVSSCTHFKVCKYMYKLFIEITLGWRRKGDFRFPIYILLYCLISLNGQVLLLLKVQNVLSILENKKRRILRLVSKLNSKSIPSLSPCPILSPWPLLLFMESR